MMKEVNKVELWMNHNKKPSCR